MAKTPEAPPTFSTEAEERDFWERMDSADLIDWDKAERVRMPSLEPSKAAISLRLPLSLLERIKGTAH